MIRKTLSRRYDKIFTTTTTTQRKRIEWKKIFHEISGILQIMENEK